MIRRRHPWSMPTKRYIALVSSIVLTGALLTFLVTGRGSDADAKTAVHACPAVFFKIANVQATAAFTGHAADSLGNVSDATLTGSLSVHATLPWKGSSYAIVDPPCSTDRTAIIAVQLYHGNMAFSFNGSWSSPDGSGGSCSKAVDNGSISLGEPQFQNPLVPARTRQIPVVLAAGAASPALCNGDTSVGLLDIPTILEDTEGNLIGHLTTPIPALAHARRVTLTFSAVSNYVNTTSDSGVTTAMRATAKIGGTLQLTRWRTCFAACQEPA